MDRSMKVMFGMMTVAICLMALSMAGNQSQQAYAGEYVGGDRGTEPTIVSFRVVAHNLHHIAYRMWSDGSVEVNPLIRWDDSGEGGWNQDYLQYWPDGWLLITDSVAGYACAGDTDGNREVDIYDLLAVVDQWGQCEEDPPVNIPPDPDLM